MHTTVCPTLSTSIGTHPMPFRHWNNLLHVLKLFVIRMLRYQHSSTKWQTMGGTFKTKMESSDRLQNTWISSQQNMDSTYWQNNQHCHVTIWHDNQNWPDGGIKLKIDYTTHKIQWDDVTILMKHTGTGSEREMTQTLDEMSKEAENVKRKT